MKMLEAKPFGQYAEIWKRENRLFTSTMLEAGASEQNRIGTHALRSLKQFDSFSLLKLLFQVRNWHCWSRKAFPRQMTPKAGKKTANTAFFNITDKHEKLYGRSRLYASAQGRHETGGVLSLFRVFHLIFQWKTASRSDLQTFKACFV